MPFGAHALAASKWMMGGIGASGIDSYHAYYGMAYAPLGQLHETGPLLRGWAKSYYFSYSTELAPYWRDKVMVTGYGVEAEAGWQQAGKSWRAAAFAGVAWRHFHFMPHDANNPLLNRSFGAKFAVDGDFDVTPKLKISANAKYITGFDESWIQAKVSRPFDFGFSLGLTAASNRGKNYNNARFGSLLSGYKMHVPVIGELYLSGEVGAEWDLRARKVGPYASVHWGFGRD